MTQVLEQRGKILSVSVSHRRVDVNPKQDSNPDKKHPIKNRKEKDRDERRSKETHADDISDGEQALEEPRNKQHPQETRKENRLEESKKQRAAGNVQLEINNKTRKHDLQSEKHKPKARKERPPEEPKNTSHVEGAKEERHHVTDDRKKDGDEKKPERLMSAQQRERPPSEPPREKPADTHKPMFER